MIYPKISEFEKLHDRNTVSSLNLDQTQIPKRELFMHA